MNIVTNALLRSYRGRHFRAFVKRWDLIEALALRVYRGGIASKEDEQEYTDVRNWLLKKYAYWQPILKPYWETAMIAGEQASEDPFLRTLSIENASDFIKNWQAIQVLPAARESLNKFLLDQIELPNQPAEP
ncbi:MAG: hypothetical protein EHM41_13605 [Chloroflexi bacterium]|nr:MAG: hypothetical protein EHM41_13605 [Chloroflexota bacterium]